MTLSSPVCFWHSWVVSKQTIYKSLLNLKEMRSKNFYLT